MFRSKVLAAGLDDQLISFTIFRSKVLAAGLDDQLTAYLTWSYSSQLAQPSAWNSSRYTGSNNTQKYKILFWFLRGMYSMSSFL